MLQKMNQILPSRVLQPRRCQIVMVYDFVVSVKHSNPCPYSLRDLEGSYVVHTSGRDRARERCLYLDKLIGVPSCLRFRRWPSDVTAALTRENSSSPYLRVYVFTDVMYVLYMYVCIYVYMCYVLIRPPIPYITSSRCKRLHKFCPVEILLHERGYPRVPPCKPLK